MERSVLIIIALFIALGCAIVALFTVLRNHRTINRLHRATQIDYLHFLVLHVFPERYHKLPGRRTMLDEKEPVFTYLKYLMED